jgi:hypothetical protein
VRLGDCSPPKGSLVHAYLIFAHRNLDQLPRLIDRLDTGVASFFLHIDQKTDTMPSEGALRKLRALPNVHFVPRYHCPWATFGLVEAQKAAMEAALAEGGFTHLMLLTGQDYPLRPPHEIDSFFAAHPDVSFVGHNPGKTKIEKRKLERYKYENWHVYFAGKHYVPFRVLKRVGIKRRIPGRPRPVKGWAFFTVSQEAAEYAVRFYRENPRYVRFWRRAKHADEYFWHTILLNSALTGKVSNTTLRYVRFVPPTGHTMTFGIENLEELKAASSDYFFAGKLDSTVDAQILDLIDRDLLQRPS